MKTTCRLDHRINHWKLTSDGNMPDDLSTRLSAGGARMINDVANLRDYLEVNDPSADARARQEWLRHPPQLPPRIPVKLRCKRFLERLTAK